MLRCCLVLLCSLCLLSGFSQTLSIPVNDHRLLTDDELSMILVQAHDLSAYGDLTGYDELMLTGPDGEYTFVQLPDALSHDTSYNVLHNSQNYTLYFTPLPLLSVTADVDIPNDYKIAADFSYADEEQLFTSVVGIELRGGFSIDFPKKTYDLEFWQDETGAETLDAQFGDLRSDDDWILDALYNEPLRLRSHVSHRLWLDIHTPGYESEEPEARAGADLRYVELFLNGRYNGLYNLSEQIDRKLLKLKKFNGNIRGELYKGATRNVGVVDFEVLTDYDNALRSWSGYEYKYPSATDTTEWGLLHALKDFVINAPDAEFTAHVWDRFHYENFLDYFIFLNLLRALDNTGKNIYVAKYQTGEPYFYVPWDLDGVFGTLHDGSEEFVSDDILANEFHNRVIALDPQNYSADVSARWATLRETTLNEATLLGRFSAHYQFLSENKLYEREAMVYPNYDFGNAHLDYLNDWLHDRLVFLDDYFGYTSNLSAPSVAGSITPFPNPATDRINFPDTEPNQTYFLYDPTGKLLRHRTLDDGTISVGDLPAGFYFIHIGKKSGKFMVR